MRTHFWVKPSLQWRHLVWTLAMITVAILACWIFVNHAISASLDRGTISGAAGAMLRTNIHLGFLLIYVMALAWAGVENYFFFHRVAGPLFVLERAIRQMADGNFGAPIRIRESDQVADL